MIFKKSKSVENPKYDSNKKEPIIKASICNGEQVVGFRNLDTGDFQEVMFISCNKDLEKFKNRYGIKGDIKKIY